MKQIGIRVAYLEHALPDALIKCIDRIFPFGPVASCHWSEDSLLGQRLQIEAQKILMNLGEPSRTRRGVREANLEVRGSGSHLPASGQFP